MRRGHARHRRRAGEFETEARLVRDAQDGRGQGQRAALDDLITRERRRAGTIDRDGEVAEDGEVGRLGDVLDRAASVAVGGDGKAAGRRDVAGETADVERAEAGLEDRRGAGVAEDVRDGDGGLRSGDLDVPQRRRDRGRTGEVEAVEASEDDGADAGSALTEGERILDAEIRRSGEQAGAAGHADGAGAERTGETARDRHGAGADDEAARGGVDAAREGVLAAELQEAAARLGDAAVLDDAVDDEGGGERRHVATGDRDGADVHGEGRRAVEVEHAVPAGSDRLRADDRGGRGVGGGRHDAAGEGEDAAGVEDDAAAAAVVEGERGQTVRAGQVRLGVTRHEDGLLRDQAAIARIGVGEGVERVRTSGDVRAAGDGERIASDVDAGDILISRGSGDAPDRHADREPGDDGRGGGDGGAARGRGRANHAEERVIGGLPQGAVVDDDAPGAETSGRVEVDGRGVDDRAAGVDVGAGEGQRRVRLTAVGAGDDEPDRAGGAVVDDVGGKQAAAAIVAEGRMPDVEIGGRADDAGGQVAVADGQQTVAVVLGHHQAAVAKAQRVTLEAVVGVRVPDIDRERADGGVRQHRHEAGLGGVDVVGVGREAVETGAREAREARTVDAADAVDRVEAGEDAVDDGPRTEQAVGEGRGGGDLDAGDADIDRAQLAEIIETDDRRGARRTGQRPEREIRGSVGPGAATGVIGEDLVETIHQGHGADGLGRRVEGLACEVEGRSLQADGRRVVDAVRQREVVVVDGQLGTVQLDRRSGGDAAGIHHLQGAAGDDGRGGVIAEGMQGHAAAARLDDQDIAGDATRVAVVRVRDEHRALAVGIRDGSALDDGGAARIVSVEGRDILRAAVQVEHTVAVDLQVIVREQGAGTTVGQTQRAVIDRGRAAVELESVEGQDAAQVLGEAGGAGDARGDRQGLAVGDMEEAFGAERDERHGQRGGRAGSVDQDRAGGEGERARVQAAETADGGDARVGVEVERQERLVAGERVRAGRLEDGGRRGRQDVRRGGIAGEGPDADGRTGTAVVGGPFVAVDGGARDDARGGGAGRRGGVGDGSAGTGTETNHVGRRAEGALEVIGAAGVEGVEGRPLEGAGLPAHGVVDLDDIEPVVAPELTGRDLGGSGRRVDDQAERAAVQRQSAVIETIGDISARVIEHDGAAGMGFVPSIPIGDPTGGTEHEGAVTHDDLVGIELAGGGAVDVEVDRRPLHDADGGRVEVGHRVEIDGAAAAEARGVGPGADAGEVERRAGRGGPDGAETADVGDGAGERVITRDGTDDAAVIDADAGAAAAQGDVVRQGDAAGEVQRAGRGLAGIEVRGDRHRDGVAGDAAEGVGVGDEDDAPPDGGRT